jgi:hypothetical protein
MSRCGCPEEDTRQKPDSPGVVLNEEAIVFVLPLCGNQDGLRNLENGKLQKKQLSICRAEHCDYSEMYREVVQRQVAAGGAAKYRGYFWALCSEIRDILADPRPNKNDEANPPRNVGAFCVIDDGDPDYRAHGLIGYSSPSKGFWSQNDRTAARGNLWDTFRKRGIQNGNADPPFKTDALTLEPSSI